MNNENQIPEPLLFNPLKHFLPFIKEFVNIKITGQKDQGLKDLIKEIRHIGSCVMDIYTGELSQRTVFDEVLNFLNINNIADKDSYKKWTGTKYNDYRIISLSDGSKWTLKYHENEFRYIHIFPARASQHTFRIKANTLKSAVLYLVLIGKDYISEDDLNTARALAGLSPIREVADAEAVTEMIEMLRV
jgi:hypothetical protein